MPDNDDATIRARARATLLLTRPRAASERFAAQVRARGLPLDIVIAPLMEIVATDPTPRLAQDAEVIFTSSHAVALAGPGEGRRAWCVGPRTTEAAELAGFDAVMAGTCAEDLIARLLDLKPEGSLVHLHGAHQRGDVAMRLRDAGLSVTSHMLYDQKAVGPDTSFYDALKQARLCIALFSPRSAALFTSAAGPNWHPGPSVRIVTLSAAVQGALPPFWRPNAHISDRPDGPSMLDAIAERIFP